MRKSDHIDHGAAQNILEAATFAEQTGRPLNRFVTVHWGLANGGGVHRKRLALLLERARHFLARNGASLACVWSHEHDRSKSLHSHILFHVPHGLGAAFERNLPRWIGGGDDGYLDIRQPNDAGILGYILKDADPVDYAQLGIHRANRRKRSSRQIEGKRCGVSQNLGPTARSRWVSPAAETAPQLATLAA
jgi:hypothetical protein